MSRARWRALLTDAGVASSSPAVSSERKPARPLARQRHARADSAAAARRRTRARSPHGCRSKPPVPASSQADPRARRLDRARARPARSSCPSRLGSRRAARAAVESRAPLDPCATRQEMRWSQFGRAATGPSRPGAAATPRPDTKPHSTSSPRSSPHDNRYQLPRAPPARGRVAHHSRDVRSIPTALTRTRADSLL